MTVLSLIIRVILTLIAVYYFVRPQKLLARRPTWTVRKVRIIAGLLIAVQLILILHALVDFGSSGGKVNVEVFNDTFKRMIAKCPAELQSDPVTLACVNTNVKALKDQASNLPPESLRLAAMGSCCCQIASWPPEWLAEARKDLASGVGELEALDRISKKPGYLDKMKHCAE